ncbi:hypothetical protein GPJ56_004770 [Histomonas meleagridis]|uniref:uncharacterized protein n=1 Tax=Histomonas meleagridis TaxID=135588 RepID=UPI00355A5277|nr:hypothetical protein GPJ56_004770 [Histomonas meleagridis]KAH0801668.1 hypothetical protein GO595_005503 [Histomonas meleagridis]
MLVGLFFLFEIVFCVHKELNISTFVEGEWNATISHINSEGEIGQSEGLIFINFTKESEMKNSFIGTLKGYDYEFDVRIIISDENPQQFTIEKDFPLMPHQFVTKAEMTYGKRNMPYARGKWQNSTQHFQILVFTQFRFELSIYRTHEKTVEVIRFVKTPKPQYPSIFSAILPSILIGILFIIYKLYRVHEYIEDQEAKSKQAAAKKKGEEGKSPNQDKISNKQKTE